VQRKIKSNAAPSEEVLLSTEKCRFVDGLKGKGRKNSKSSGGNSSLDGGGKKRLVHPPRNQMNKPQHLKKRGGREARCSIGGEGEGEVKKKR